MLNIQKYKDEIIEETKELSLECAAAKLAGFNCSDRKCSECRKKTMEWLLEEYKEPTLTEKEKAYLKNVIKPKRNDVTIVVKSLVGKPNKYFTVNVYNKNSYNIGYESRLLEFIVTEDLPFKNMELYKHYTLEELGL